VPKITFASVLEICSVEVDISASKYVIFPAAASPIPLRPLTLVLPPKIIPVCTLSKRKPTVISPVIAALTDKEVIVLNSAESKVTLVLAAGPAKAVLILSPEIQLYFFPYYFLK
jgi:hypothetical protein